MFSFHKPKVYRSSTGCCICKAKSSSSRFTDSKKYEEDFLECFQLSVRRQGEICNACVLLVKRWKKLPDGSKRNWRHVVDARAGPGMKSMTKFKSKQKKQLLLMGEHLAENKRGIRRERDEFEREYSPTLSDKSDEMDMDYSTLMTGGESPQQNGTNGTNGTIVDSGGSSPRLSNHSPNGSDCEDNNFAGGNTVVVGSRRRKAVLSHRRKLQRSAVITEIVGGFVDTDYWTKESICCGIIFRGQNGEVLVDASRGCRLKPCSISLQKHRSTATSTIVEPVEIAIDQLQLPTTTVIVQASNNGDNSSDSGYDDSLTVGNSIVASNPIETTLHLPSVRRKQAQPPGTSIAIAVSSIMTAVVD